MFDDHAQQVSFGTSGIEGPFLPPVVHPKPTSSRSLKRSANYRRSHATDGPLYMGKDPTTRLSGRLSVPHSEKSGRKNVGPSSSATTGSRRRRSSPPRHTRSYPRPQRCLADGIVITPRTILREMAGSVQPDNGGPPRHRRDPVDPEPGQRDLRSGNLCQENGVQPLRLRAGKRRVRKDTFVLLRQ